MNSKLSSNTCNITSDNNSKYKMYKLHNSSTYINNNSDFEVILNLFKKCNIANMYKHSYSDKHVSWCLFDI